MHLSMFFPRKGEGGITLENYTIFQNWGLILNPCDTILCQQSSGRAFKFRHSFFKIFSLKHRRSRHCAKVVCQIPEGSDYFGSLIPNVSPPPPLWVHYIWDISLEGVYSLFFFLDKLCIKLSVIPYEWSW